MKKCFAALAAVLLAGGCGHPSHQSSSSTAPRITFVAPESARTPDDAQLAEPPVSLAPPTTNLMHISAKGLRLIEGFEGWSSCPYWDPYGHVWTRGYGETEGIRSGSACISRAQGETKLRALVETRYEWALRSLGVQLNQNQWDALCSFVWNLGAGIFQNTTVGADLHAKAWRAAADSMLQYDHAGGVVLAGLATRRQAEVRLFLTPVPRKRNIAAERGHLHKLEKELPKIRQHVVRSKCGGRHYRAACRPLRRRGAAVKHEIVVLRKRGVR